ncbi:hypothetical protein Tco_1536810 [Tanacetum coccineum]
MSYHRDKPNMVIIRMRCNNIEEVEELKRIVRIKGVKKEAIHTTLGKTGSMHNLSVITKPILVLKTSNHGPSDAMHNPPSCSGFSQKKFVSFLTEYNTLLSTLSFQDRRY